MRLTGSSVLALIALLLSPMPGVAAQPDQGSPGLVAEQNLFHPSRSVPPPPAPPVPAAPVAQPAPPPAPPPKFELSGVVRVDGAPSIALLLEPQLTRGKVWIVSLGEPVGPYKLVAVEDDRVRLEAEGRAVTVLLHDPARRPKAAAAAAVAASAPVPDTQPGRRLRAPGPEAAPAGASSAASEEPSAADHEAETKPGSVMNVFEKAFGGFFRGQDQDQ